jgi:hypothetical protein
MAVCVVPINLRGITGSLSPKDELKIKIHICSVLGGHLMQRIGYGKAQPSLDVRHL